MTREDMIRLLGQWIGEITEKAPPKLGPDTDLTKDLSLDSLSLAELGARLRTHCQVRIRPGEMAHNLKVGALIDLIEDKLRHKEN